MNSARSTMNSARKYDIDVFIVSNNPVYLSHFKPFLVHIVIYILL